MNFNANLVNDMAKYAGSRSPIVEFHRDNHARFNSTMNDIVQTAPGISSIAYLTDTQNHSPNRIRMIGNNTGNHDEILDERKEKFENKNISISTDFITIIIVAVVLFSLYSIVNIYISQKRLEFMLNLIYSKQAK